MKFSRPEYWGGKPFPTSGDLSHPGIKPRASALQVILYQLSYQGSLYICIYNIHYIYNYTLHIIYLIYLIYINIYTYIFCCLVAELCLTL